MNILITGGLGYIGGRIAAYCKKKDSSLDISITTRKDREYLPSWTKDFTVIPLELLDEQSIQKCISDSKPDCIIHLAAVNEIDSKLNPELAEEVNYRGTEKLLQIAHVNKVKRFIYFSTFHVYGKLTESIITELIPAQPFGSYASTHLAAEKAVVLFRKKGMNTLIFRVSNGYGYPMDKNINRWTLVVNDLCRQAVVVNKIVLKSSGKQCRDFISLQDIAQAVYYFLCTILDRWGDGLYNLGGNCTMSILDMARKVSEVYCEKYNREHLEIKTSLATVASEKSRHFSYSIDKLIATGFSLEGDMKTEISKTMDVYEEFLG